MQFDHEKQGISLEPDEQALFNEVPMDWGFSDVNELAELVIQQRERIVWAELQETELPAGAAKQQFRAQRIKKLNIVNRMLEQLDPYLQPGELSEEDLRRLQNGE